ncbi:MAG: CapA family protein, partial [Burkholderiaceae bacterium]
HKMLERLDQMPEMQHVLQGLDVDKFYSALHHRAHYLLNGFFWPEFAMYFAKPSTIVGSFFIRHHTFRVRIDDVEHYLSGYVAYWKMLQDQQQQKPTSTGIPAESIQAREIISGASATAPTAGTAARVAALPTPAPRPHAVWGGDVNLGRRQHYRVAELGEDQVLDIPALRHADLSIINLECVVSHLGEQGVAKGEGGPFYYRARPEMLRVLAAANIDIVTTANNHGGDYGAEALLDQGRWLDAVGIGHTGSGNTFQDALKPAYRRAGNLNVAVFSLDATMPQFAATDVRPGIAHLPISPAQQWLDQLGPAITTAKKFAHIVLVAVHWGSNGASEPRAAEKAVGKALIDAGADAVLGASAHVLQGVEIYQGRPIIHDAGNLLFDSVRSTLGDGGVFRLELSHNGVESVEFIPVGIGFGFSQQLVGDDAIAAVQRYAKKCADLGTYMSVRPPTAGQIHLAPEPRARIDAPPAPLTQYRLEALDAADGCQNPVWQPADIPDDARIPPIQLGPLTLLGIRVAPRRIERREMLWVETFWQANESVQDDLRLNIQAHPIAPNRMPPWGRDMEHDPCDWNLPTSRWKPGIIYRDFYGLRPPRMQELSNGSLQLQINIVGLEQPIDFVTLSHKVEVALSSRKTSTTKVASLPQPLIDTLPQQRTETTWTAQQVVAATGGTWLIPPSNDWFVRSVVRSASHIPLLPSPVLYVASDFSTLTRHEQYSNPEERSRVNWNTHNYLHQLQHLLAGAIVEHPPQGLAADFPLLQVKDPIQALIDLGITSRKRLEGRLVAITGSSGKTSTVGLFRSVFNPLMHVFSTYDNYNSRVGMMVNMASVPQTTQLVALEISSSAINAPRFKPIRLIQPDIAVITSAGAVHLNADMGVRDVALRKAAIFKGMMPGAIAVICRDIEHFSLIAEQAALAGLKLISYGEHPEADIQLILYDLNALWVEARVFDEVFQYTLGIPGRHHAVNSLSCLAVARELGVRLDTLREGLLKTSPVKGRGLTQQLIIENKNICIIDETYNANPDSMAAALETFSMLNTDGRKVVVLGDMLELGALTQHYHDALLTNIDNCRPDMIYLVGPMMSRLASPLRERNYTCHTYKVVTPLLTTLSHELADKDTVLFKASHG